jgi:pilus assembly protein CpaE
MRVVVAHTPGSNIREIRGALAGAGLDCTAEDCVVWDDLAVRLEQVQPDLLVIKTAQVTSADWNALEDATARTKATIIAVGPLRNENREQEARQAGAVEYIDQDNLREGLDKALDRMVSKGIFAQSRGQMISVWAPTPGSGGTTIAANLAAALARKHADDVSLIELVHDSGDLALMLGIEPSYTVADACLRMDSLDPTSLNHGFVSHPRGFRVLAGSVEPAPEKLLTAESVRRVTVLARVMFGNTVLALDHRRSAATLEAMRLSDQIALVVRPDVVSLRRARAALTAALDAGIPQHCFQLVVNRWGQGGQLNLRQVEETVGLQHSVLLPDDSTLANRAINGGQLLGELASRAKLTRRIAELAKKLSKNTAPASHTAEV